MKIVCAWCKRSLGEKATLDDESETHGICPSCSEKEVRKLGMLDRFRRAPDERSFIFKSKVLLEDGSIIEGLLLGKGNSIEEAEDYVDKMVRGASYGDFVKDIKLELMPE